jgi:NAD(P)-dependent dehydrogenase (short-subunit alcohol dehydrogenase family)
LATAKRCVAEGACVFITGRRQTELDVAIKSIGRNVTGIHDDFAKLVDIDRIYTSVKEQKGRIDVLFANAGGDCGRATMAYRYEATEKFGLVSTA